MATAAITTTGCLEWTACRRAMAGEVESGDQYVVRAFADADGETGALAAVVDGLGHGVEAAVAAKEAIRVLGEEPGRAPAAQIKACHEALRRTRGVVANVAAFHPGQGMLHWISVGNVEGVLLRGETGGAARREYLLQRGGVVGYQLPSPHILREAVVKVDMGDMLIFATDGVRSGFVEGLTVGQTPEDMAAGIMERFGRNTDDALVLVARYLGKTS
jgi:phosphoserine phosphatase RsbX